MRRGQSSWVSFPEFGAYCAAKSAQWSLTNTLRVQLADQGIRVAGLHVGYMDTDMVRTVDAAKSARGESTPDEGEKKTAKKSTAKKAASKKTTKKSTTKKTAAKKTAKKAS